MNYYNVEYSPKELELLDQFYKQTGYLNECTQPYFIKSSTQLFNKLKHGCTSGITATACNFFSVRKKEFLESH